MSRPGAKPLLDKDKAKRICKLVADGAPMIQAAESVGVCEKTLYNWMNAGGGENPDPQFLQFLQGVRAARAKALIKRIGRIGKHGAKSWQADAWWCERMFPDEFGGDKRAVKELTELVAKLRAELEVASANARRAAKRARRRRKKDRGTGDRPPA
jgi:AraC-like DNA-binding protein